MAYDDEGGFGWNWDTYNSIVDPIFAAGEWVGEGIGEAGDYYNEQAWWLSPNWFKGVGKYYSPAFEVGGPLGQKDSDGDGIPDADEEPGMENWAGPSPDFDFTYDDLLTERSREFLLEDWKVTQPNALEQFETLFKGENLTPLSGEEMYDANRDGFINELDLYLIDEDYAVGAGAEGYYEEEETAFGQAEVGIDKLERELARNVSDLEFVKEEAITTAKDDFATGVGGLGSAYAEAWQGLKEEAGQAHIGGLAGAGVEGGLSGQQEELSSQYTRGAGMEQSALRTEIESAEEAYEQGLKSLEDKFESDVLAQTDLIEEALKEYRRDTYDPYYDEYYTEYGYDFEGDKGLWWENPWDTYSEFQLEDDPARLSAIADASQAATEARQERQALEDEWKGDFETLALDFLEKRSVWEY